MRGGGMDRALTRRIFPALAALLLALAAGGCATKDAGESSADKSIYRKMPASPDDPAFGEFAGIVVGAARICRRYLHILSDRDEQLQIIQDHFSDWESFDNAAERFRRLTHGVDGWRGNIRAICVDTGRKLDDIIARLEDTARTDGVIVNHARVNEAVQLEDTARTGGVIVHSRMENGEPQSFLSRADSWRNAKSAVHSQHLSRLDAGEQVSPRGGPSATQEAKLKISLNIISPPEAKPGMFGGDIPAPPKYLTRRENGKLSRGCRAKMFPRKHPASSRWSRETPPPRRPRKAAAR